MFLPGQDDINKAVKMLNEGVAALPPDSCMDLLVLPIYAALPPDLQVLECADTNHTELQSQLAHDQVEATITLMPCGSERTLPVSADPTMH